MEIKLNWIKEKNFMGVKDFTLNAGGKNVTVKGDNATYKSTQATAFLWLLFGKNASNQSDFAVKPLDVNGNEIHFLETEVEAELLVDGKPLKLKKILAENWVKPRGQEQQEYKGNETTYYFDEVPVKQTVYKQKVSELIDEETFKLITNPLFFNDEKAFDWKKRRLKLFEVCGSLTDLEIIASSQKLAKLPEVLDGKSVDDRKIIIKSSISKLNTDIDAISPKINENKRLIPETAVDYSETEKQLAGLKMELEAIEKQLSDAGNVVTEFQRKQRDLYSLNGSLDSVKKRIDATAYSGDKRLSIEKQQLLNDKFRLEADINGFRLRTDQNKKQIEINSQERQKLLKEWANLNEALLNHIKEVFTEPAEGSFSCPTCGQDLPDETREQKLNQLRTNWEREFNSTKTILEKTIATNIDTGKSLKANTDSLQTFITDFETKISLTESKVADIDIRLDEIEEELKQPVQGSDYSSDAEYVELVSKIEKLQAELDKPIEDTSAEIRLKKQEIQSQINICNATLNNRDVVANAEERIEELKRQEKDIASQKSKLEGQIFLIEEFIRAKADMLSDAINNRFKYVRFKLFDQLQNGGLSETCETLVNTNGCWVPYSDGNTAGKANAGLDIINSLIDFYGVTAPIFFDNAESITELIQTKAQVIKLVKPEIVTDADRRKYGMLNVEVEG